MFISVIRDARAWILAKYAPSMSSSFLFDRMVCSVIRIVFMETFSSFAVAWIFTAVSGDTPSSSWMVERSFFGKDVGFGDLTGDGDGFGSAVVSGAGVNVGDGDDAGGSGVSVSAGGDVTTGVGAGTSVGGMDAGSSGVGWADPANVTTTVWLLWTSVIL